MEINHRNDMTYIISIKIKRRENKQSHNSLLDIPPPSIFGSLQSCGNIGKMETSPYQKLSRFYISHLPTDTYEPSMHWQDHDTGTRSD